MIPITQPVLGEEEAQAAAAVVRTGWLAQGCQVAAFEQAFAQRVGARHAVAVASGTVALHLSLIAHGIGPGDEVLVPSLSFIASANAVTYTGATPVFVDVNPRSFNLDPQLLAGALTCRTRAILPVHQLGLPAEMEAIIAFAEQHHLHLVEDAACALGAVYRGRAIGGMRHTCCFSFHPRKVITTGEGGMITTDDDEFAEKLRALRSHGMRLSAHTRHAAQQMLPDETYEHLGYNYRLTDIQAAIGLVQLTRLSALLERRRLLAHRYTQLLAQAAPAILPPWEPEETIATHSFQSYMVLLQGPFRPPWSREAVQQHLLAQGIATRSAVTAIHEQPLYHDAARAPLPISTAVTREGLLLPLYPALEESEQDRIVAALLAACPAL